MQRRLNGPYRLTNRGAAFLIVAAIAAAYIAFALGFAQAQPPTGAPITRMDAATQLRPAPPAPPTIHYQRTRHDYPIVAAAAATLPLPAEAIDAGPTTYEVYRNGQLLRAATDYTVSADRANLVFALPHRPAVEDAFTLFYSNAEQLR